MMRALVVAGIMAAGVMGAISFGSGDRAFAGSTNNTLTLDLDTATAGIQSSFLAASGATVQIAVVASNVGAGGAYAGYQWEIEYPDAGLDFVSNSENTAGHGGSLCATAATIDNPNDASEDWTGQGAGCLLASGTTTFEGNLVTIMIQCTADGSHNIHLVTITEDDVFGSSYLDPGGQLKATEYGGDALLSCGAAVDTPTPTATNTSIATNTPAPNATNTPCTGSICNNPPFTRTQTPTNTTTPGTPTPGTGTTPPPGGGSPAPAATNTRTGGAGGQIGGPDTGQGSGGDGGSDLMAALLISGAGLALVAAGGWKLRQRTARSRG